MESKKSVFITGGTKGIGKSVALFLAQKGYSVKVAGRSSKALEETLSEIKKIDTTAEGFQLDVSETKKLQSTIEGFSSLYGLICCAGIYGPIGALSTLNLDEWKNTFDVNVMGSVAAVQSAARLMEASGTPGRIVLFGGGGQGPMPGFSSYVSTKGAIVRFCETVGAELAEKNIFMNAIAPGFVMTELQQNVLNAGPDAAGSGFFEKVKQADAQNGGVSPELSAKLCDYLLSEQSFGLWGKLISAQWDKYDSFNNLEQLSSSDIFSMRRVMHENGGTRP